MLMEYLASDYFKLLMATVDDLENLFWYVQANEGGGALCVWLSVCFFSSPLCAALHVGKR